MLVSIIIPVYNKEKYLDKCIQSAVNQDYNKIEIIIINDGSKDNSEKIINEWVKKDKRIKYLSQENKGVSCARNKGISISKGEYIFFLDADDILTENAITSLVQYINGINPDIIIGNFYEKRNNQIIKKQETKNKLYKGSDLYLTNTILDMFVTNHRYMATAGNKLYNINFIKKNEIMFKDNVIAEDRLFNLMCYVNNPKIYVVNEYTYIYNIIENSRSRKIFKNFYEENISLIYFFYEYLNKKSLFSKYKRLFELNVIFDVYKLINLAFEYSDKRLYMTNYIVKELRNDKLIKSTVENVINYSKLKEFHRSKKIKKILLINYFLLYAPYFIYIYKKIGYITRGLRLILKN